MQTSDRDRGPGRACGQGVGAVYRRFDNRPTVTFGTPHERVATIFEVTRNHHGVVREFLRRPGRWILWLDLDEVRRGDDGGRYLQFVFLEDGVSAIAECSANQFLPGALQLSAGQMSELRGLGWHDPDPSRSPNWHLVASTAEELDRLVEATCRTILEVFGLRPGDLTVIRFQERGLGPEDGQSPDGGAGPTTARAGSTGAGPRANVRSLVRPT
jgi:hypothetical protein